MEKSCVTNPAKETSQEVCFKNGLEIGIMLRVRGHDWEQNGGMQMMSPYGSRSQISVLVYPVWTNTE